MAHGLVMVQAEINRLRAAYGRCAECSYKQMGLRRLRDAEAFLGRNSDHALQQLGWAKYYLPYAQTNR